MAIARPPNAPQMAATSDGSITTLLIL